MITYSVTYPFIQVDDNQIVLTLSLDQAKILKKLTNHYIWELKHPDWGKEYFSKEDNEIFSRPVCTRLADRIADADEEICIWLTVEQAQILNKLVKYNIEEITTFDNILCIPGHNELLAEPLSLLLSSFLNYIEDVNGSIVWHTNTQN